MPQYLCRNCGKECFAKYKSHEKSFCSHQCANEFRWKNVPKKVITLVCQHCGNEFVVKKSDYRLKSGGIKYCSKACSFEARKTGTIVQCKTCGKEFYSTRQKFCSPECSSSYRSKHSPKKLYMENGYLVEHVKGYNKKGNAKKHRLVVEEAIGRRLTKDEVVHHINGDKTDNRLENLKIMSRSEHSSFHRKDEKANGKHLFGGHNNN